MATDESVLQHTQRPDNADSTHPAMEETHSREGPGTQPTLVEEIAAQGSVASSETEKAPAERGSTTEYHVQDARSTDNASQLRQPSQTFDPRKQFRGLLLAGLLRWLVTAVIIAGLYGVLTYYSRLRVMDRRTKRQFNVLVTGLSIALGLSIASSLKRIASEMRWWILSRRERSLREMDLILGIECITRVIQLVFTTSRWTVHLTASAWLGLHVISQIAVAALALTYTVDTTEGYAVFHPGEVAVPDMSHIQPQNSFVTGNPKLLGALQYTANSYGTMALAYNVATLDDIADPGQIWFPEYPLFFCGPELYCEYVFSESSPNPDEGIIIITDRSIRASAVCDSWPVIRGGSGNGTEVVAEQDDGGTFDVPMPLAGGSDQTTFITNDTSRCGPACSIVGAFEASDTDPWYYQCNVTIGNVTNARIPEHLVGANLTALASGAIALQGYAASSLTRDPHMQYQIYPAESTYGMPHGGIAELMGLTMARFAIGVVAVAAQSNEEITVAGNTPVTGTTLNVGHWMFVHLILLLSGGLQLLLAVGGALLANRVVVHDDSHLVAAHLLRGVVDKVGDGSTIASGKEIAKIASAGGGEKYAYGAEKLEGRDAYRLKIASGKPSRLFPRGQYD